MKDLYSLNCDYFDSIYLLVCVSADEGIAQIVPLTHAHALPGGNSLISLTPPCVESRLLMLWCALVDAALLRTMDPGFGVH